MTFDTYLYAPAPRSLSSRLAEAFRAWLAQRRHEVALRHSIRGMERLDDRMLRDIGLTRGDYEMLRRGLE